MIHKNIIIGSGFSSIGAVLGLNEKKQNFTVVTGKASMSKNVKNQINLPSRDFSKYKNNIFYSYKNNNLKINIKNNFISFLGLGGLSNLWGKIFNLDIKAEYKRKKYLINKLQIKNHRKIILHKKINFYKIKEQNFNIKNIYKNLKKNKIKFISATVEKINYLNKRKVFEIHLTDKKILICENIYLACGVFSTLKLLRTLHKDIFKKKIQLQHSDMCYGIFFANKKYIKKIIGDEFIYFENKKNEFAGRISILNDKIIKKYNLNSLYFILGKITNLFNIKIFVLSILYKRGNNASIIQFKEKDLDLKVIATKKNNYILSKLKKIFKESFNANIFVFKKTLVGSDFHYSCDITKGLNLKVIKKFSKNIFILDSAYSRSHTYFPTFQMIYESFNRVQKNISLNKII